MAGHSYLDTRYPFTDPGEPGYIHQCLRQAYVAARLADLPVALTRERDGLARDAALYLVPSVKQLLAPTWVELDELAIGGATVYVSYSAGATEWHRGPSYGRLGTMFGLSHRAHSGCHPEGQPGGIERSLWRPRGPRRLVSQANKQLTVEPRLADGLALAPERAVTVPPYGVAVFRRARGHAR